MCMVEIIKKSIFVFFFLYAVILLSLCIWEKYSVRECETDETEVEVSGNFFNAYHDVVALIEKNPQIKMILYIVSPSDSIVDKQELFDDKDYVEYLVKSNLPFLSWQDWKFLVKNNPVGVISGILAYPFCFDNVTYNKGHLYDIGTSSPDYLYSMINYCNERGVKIQPVFFPNPKNSNKKDVGEGMDLLQYYVGGVLDYRKQYVAQQYMDEKGLLTEDGYQMILKAIKDNIHGVHSQEYVELNKVENIPSDNPLISLIQSSKKVVFVGNSITDGCNNGGYGWYEPLMAAFPNVETIKIAKGGVTSDDMVQWCDSIAALDADLCVISAGCNDIKVGDPKVGAVSYIRNMQLISDRISKVNGNVHLVFVAPWQRYPETEVETPGRMEYTKALKMWCEKNGFLFVNPNPYIADRISKSKYFNYYMVDRTHPNSSNGIKLYSEAVINS